MPTTASHSNHFSSLSQCYVICHYQFITTCALKWNHCADASQLSGLDGARASGRCTDVYLHVREKDYAAMELYKKAGFQVHRRESIPGGIFGMMNGRRAQILMKYELNQLSQTE